MQTKSEFAREPLSERKLKILKAVIEQYIKNGEPVGSKLLCGILDFPVSSATVRNEMAELSELGFLMQPHTSAGREPSEIGFRYYIENLMMPKAISSNEKTLILEYLQNCSDPDSLIRCSAEISSEILQTASITTTPFSEQARIYSLKFVQTGRQSCLLVLVTSDGLVKTGLFKCDYVLTEDIIKIYENIFNREMSGLPVKDVTPAYIQTLAVSLGEIALLVPNVLNAIMNACREVGDFNMVVAGRTRLIDRVHSTADMQELKELTNFLHSDDELQSILLKMRSGKKILVGSQIGSNALANYSFIASQYKIDVSSGGSVAAVVPMRFDYAYASAVLDYIAECVGKILRDILMIE